VEQTSSTAQSSGWLGSNRAVGGDAKSDRETYVASLAGLRSRTRDTAGIWSAAAGCASRISPGRKGANSGTSSL